MFDGKHYWLWDGFHRRFAAVKAKLDKLKCVITEGTREDARWLSYGANIDHGLQRTNEDKAKAVQSALRHPKGAKLSDTKIAEHVGATDKTVAKYRKQLETASEIPKVTEREGSDGKTYDTTNIGKPRTEDVTPSPPAKEPEVDQHNDTFDTAELDKQTPKPGSEKKSQFKDGTIDDLFGKLIRAIDDRWNKHGGHGNKYRICLTDVRKAFDSWKDWRRG